MSNLTKYQYQKPAETNRQMMYYVPKVWRPTPLSTEASSKYILDIKDAVLRSNAYKRTYYDVTFSDSAFNSFDFVALKLFSPLRHVDDVVKAGYVTDDGCIELVAEPISQKKRLAVEIQPDGQAIDVIRATVGWSEMRTTTVDDLDLGEEIRWLIED